MPGTVFINLTGPGQHPLEAGIALVNQQRQFSHDEYSLRRNEIPGCPTAAFPAAIRRFYPLHAQRQPGSDRSVPTGFSFPAAGPAPAMRAESFEAGTLESSSAASSSSSRKDTSRFLLIPAFPGSSSETRSVHGRSIAVPGSPGSGDGIRTLRPTPITASAVLLPADCNSTRMPASFLPWTRMSLGHLIPWPCSPARVSARLTAIATTRGSVASGHWQSRNHQPRLR